MAETTATPQTTITPRRKPLYISLRVKLLVIFLVLFAVMFGGVFYWFHDFAVDRVRSRLEEDLETILLGMAGQIDGDQFEALVKAGETAGEEGYYPPKPSGDNSDELSQLYWDHVDFLYEQRLIIGDDRVRFYTFIDGDSGADEVIFIGSSSAASPTPEEGVSFFLRWKPATADEYDIIAGGLKEKTLYTTIYEDEFGRWISGYAPIKNSQNLTVGAVGVDFLASYVEEVEQDVESGIMVATGITSIVVIVMVFLISGFLTRPVIALTRHAERIGEGDYEQDLSGLTPGRFSDEIGTLAQVFEIMVGKVHRREEKLKQQVVELQIMIDESKRQEQVEGIVDTDFFRDLQSKAKKMREGFAAKTSSQELPAVKTSETESEAESE
jgi:HAMP domain-containing protein